ncbi:hypothetical protein [Nocardioides sp.]|uniref:hypothetical protein n=1 Tax=Nocardioides sp. TaxID=35761 RepID=UPI00286C32D4|nr:hypothetical protein [Nocardioides sp.]
MAGTRSIVETRRIVELACAAPSVHNSQPWLWALGEDRIELHADPSRRLPRTDPRGRELTLSCGAALHHARVAAAALGLPAEVEYAPDLDRPSHLATLHLSTGEPSAAAAAELDTLAQRCTDRRRFTAWPVPDELLAALAGSSSAPGAQVLPLVDISSRLRVELLVNRALDRQERCSAPSGEHVQGSDGLLVLLTERDDPRAWLSAGEALSEVWLAATADGLSLVPLSCVIEDDDTRSELHREVLGGLAEPQLVMRIGWQQIGRSELRRTTRRDVSDVLLP